MPGRAQPFRVNMTWLLAIVGGVIAFVLSGAIVAAAWVAFGAAVGGAIGWVVQRFTSQVKQYGNAVELADTETKAALYETAKELGIEGRSKMGKEELATAITEEQRDE